MSLKNNNLPLVLATNNSHKVVEIKSILRRAGFRARILTLDDFPKCPRVVEDKPTIEGNALKKATEIARYTGHLALADDTGLFVKALQGRPGVYSARFAGPGCAYDDNNRKLLRLLKGKSWTKRGAAFRCVAALAKPTGKARMTQGRLLGQISFEPKGRKGFGYDPIFFVPKYKKTLAELGPRLKNQISHRAQAFRKVRHLLK